MTIQSFTKEGQKGEKFTLLHMKVLEVARTLKSEQGLFDMMTLFERCIRGLPYSEPQIYQIIQDLYQMKCIVEGKLLFKEDILTNEKRRKIFEYVTEHPGAHTREIQTTFNLGSYMAFRHLAFLEKFNFIRKKPYKNKIVYFPSDSDEQEDLKVLLFRNQTINRIYRLIEDLGKVRATEISESLKIPYTTIQSHLNELVESGLISKVKENQTVFYIPTEIKESKGAIEVKREFDYLGGQIRFKVAVRNLTDMTINNIAVNLNPSDQFIADVPQQSIANLPPKTTRGIDFTLTPLTCGQSNIFGIVAYQDAYGKVHSIPINPKEISIKCPLVKPLNATQQEVNEWIKKLRRATGTIGFQKITEKEAFRIGREQINALDLNEVNVDFDNHWGLYSGEVKVTGNNMVVKLSIVDPNIILDVWADDLKQTTGFIAYISNLINLALEGSYKLVRKTHEVSTKIIQLMHLSKGLDELFSKCEGVCLETEISEYLVKSEELLANAFSDSALLRSIRETNSDLKQICSKDSTINEEEAIQLRFKCLTWLYKVQELIQYHINTYQNTFDEFNTVSDEFLAGYDTISARINELERIYAQGILCYLLILDKKSGITIFERNLGDLKINPDLVGGFLHALQSFGFEISERESSMKTLTYENYQFQIEVGEDIRAALILRGTANQYIIAKLKSFVKQFEQNFGEDIRSFSGNMSAFMPANALFDAIFK
ncbi:MAG: hypothetical protein EU536_03850 [Promethearchaeota archaeon]|nr:MAG: hypothetical protein EU536_03850 [Candidatus Lokiarchaeota archaeon]